LFGIAIKLLAAEHRESLRAEVPGSTVCDPQADDALWVRQALERLEPVEREILMLREYEQLSYSEIAELMRLPLNTVRTRLFRSRAALKEHLKPASNEA
jgi:RNA polymerase sigma-70 factor (ECF subfamily)